MLPQRSQSCPPKTPPHSRAARVLCRFLKPVHRCAVSLLAPVLFPSGNALNKVDTALHRRERAGRQPVPFADSVPVVPDLRHSGFPPELRDGRNTPPCAEPPTSLHRQRPPRLFRTVHIPHLPADQAASPAKAVASTA